MVDDTKRDVESLQTEFERAFTKEELLQSYPEAVRETLAAEKADSWQTLLEPNPPKRDLIKAIVRALSSLEKRLATP